MLNSTTDPAVKTSAVRGASTSERGLGGGSERYQPRRVSQAIPAGHSRESTLSHHCDYRSIPAMRRFRHHRRQGSQGSQGDCTAREASTQTARAEPTAAMCDRICAAARAALLFTWPMRSTNAKYACGRGCSVLQRRRPHVPDVLWMRSAAALLPGGNHLQRGSNDAAKEGSNRKAVASARAAACGVQLGIDGLATVQTIANVRNSCNNSVATTHRAVAFDRSVSGMCAHLNLRTSMCFERCQF